MKEMISPPAYKPLYEVIRINKKKTPSIDTEIYKEYLLVKKKFEENLENKNIKIIVYEHLNDVYGKTDETVNTSDSLDLCEDHLKKIRQKKNIKNVSEGEERGNVIQTEENKKVKKKKKKEKKGEAKTEVKTEISVEKTAEINSDIVVKTKSTKIIGTLKILYNFYVNLYDKIKEDVENIKNRTDYNKINLFKDVNLYSNYISMFDIINICEDLNIIKTFLNSKKECELIWILTVNYFDKVDENIFEKYKYKIDVNYEKQEPKRVQEYAEKSIKNQVETSENNNDVENRIIKNGSKFVESKREDIFQETINEKNNFNSKKLNKDAEPLLSEKSPKNEMKIKTNEKEKSRGEINDKYCDTMINRKEKIKEYIYENCSEKVNALMFRKVNFFVFVYIIIYIIKTSTRKIKAIKDDIKKIKSFFFFLNIYEKKKTIETLNNIYKDKYLNFYQNYNSSEEIENYKKRKIFRHKFSFYDINKILGNKNAEFGNLKTGMNQKKVEVAKIESTGKLEKNIESENIFSEEKILLTFKENQTDILKINNKCYEENDKNCQKEIKEKTAQENHRYKDTRFIETSELCNDVDIMNKQGNNCVNEENMGIKRNKILNSYMFDYIFKNYCYKKKYWNVAENSSIDFGIIKKENSNKKYKINIYNHSKYNIIVDVNVDKDLPVSVMFKDKLFCVSSKYTIYLEVDNSISGEKFGFVNVKLNYKNINKEHDQINIPVYIFIQD
ncbi:conserved Plasmodium protein, unknown function [Plasmodium berghei]|uniref:Uncharacterized protein n=2 Tax=Plasmodium berghei TaxID=5821 RepID=A0A509AKE4_PLABA|nr:conserved Plasmodium protein, unknown function [Plasmodium berghei ANKA]CXI27003.1 conserved Plasmodium protein, unknown function [Plasmodium berghei]SCM20550.1 conserved Plasmodium protein, unknown function [Plasmodium berghei]SCN24127.1 conserved Plasmodium protein, unknown function [Plasmodium berghei]SCO60617.1 conserved Plasmodium protein, unknown function [Plasmodium berghei]VUC55125.1 conserved Plasmodium protein, unknown function [Plasmodium berghei ANKA]|eukprot:XP_034420944.1 conserved Plasmodium protein, unknown function [Plasmodium berghei ANKA]